MFSKSERLGACPDNGPRFAASPDPAPAPSLSTGGVSIPERTPAICPLQTRRSISDLQRNGLFAQNVTSAGFTPGWFWDRDFVWHPEPPFPEAQAVRSASR